MFFWAQLVFLAFQLPGHLVVHRSQWRFLGDVPHLRVMIVGENGDSSLCTYETWRTRRGRWVRVVRDNPRVGRTAAPRHFCVTPICHFHMGIISTVVSEIWNVNLINGIITRQVRSQHCVTHMRTDTEYVTHRTCHTPLCHFHMRITTWIMAEIRILSSLPTLSGSLLHHFHTSITLTIASWLVSEEKMWDIPWQALTNYSSFNPSLCLLICLCNIPTLSIFIQESFWYVICDNPWLGVGPLLLPSITLPLLCVTFTKCHISTFISHFSFNILTLHPSPFSIRLLRQFYLIAPCTKLISPIIFWDSITIKKYTDSSGKNCH